MEDRAANYLAGENVQGQDIALKIGFRWDFLLYSATGVYAGWYYIIKHKFNDAFYTRMFNIYLFANAFWILIIRAAYSNRFAYLSWFLLGLIIVYPLIKQQFLKNQSQKLAIILAIYFAFTFFMNLILA